MDHLHRARALLATSAFFCLASAARAEDATASALLARAKAAQGGAAWDPLATLRLSGTVRAAGLTGSFETLEDLRSGRFRDAYTLGPMHEASGWDGARAWSQDSSGLSRPEEAEAPRRTAVNEVYRRSQAWWFPERWAAEVEALGERRDGEEAFQVLRITPQGGRPFELWIGPEGLFDRIVETQYGRTTTTFQSDWREVAGAKVPFRLRSTRGDGVPEHDSVLTVERAEADVPAPETAFALPPAPPPDYGLARGRASTTVPIRVLNGHVYVDVRLDGKGPFRFALDTGAVNVVTPAVAHALGLGAEGRIPGGGVGEKTEDLGMTRVKRLQIGDAYILDQTLFTFPIDELMAMNGVRMDGIVGYEVFRRFVARIDYDRGMLTLRAPGGFTYQGPGAILPFVFDEHTPQVDGEIDGIPGKFGIDTGSRASLDLLSPFVAAHGLVERYGATTVRIGGWGVGGPARGYVVRAGLLRLGPVEVPGVVTGLSVQQQGAFAGAEEAGNVGYGVLSRFVVTLDYARQRIILEKGARFAEPDAADRSGLWLHLVKGGFEVVEAVPGTPAAEAGLAEGDRIVAVDGRPAAKLGLPAVRKALRTLPAGRVVKLKVKRGGTVREVALTLRDLV